MDNDQDPNELSDLPDIGGGSGTKEGVVLGVQALKQITVATAKGVGEAGATLGTEVVAPILQLAVFAELPVLAAMMEKSFAGMKFMLGGVVGITRKIFSKRENAMDLALGDDSDDDELDLLTQINNNIVAQTEFLMGLIEGISSEVTKLTKEPSNNDGFLSQESLLEQSRTDAKNAGGVVKSTVKKKESKSLLDLFDNFFVIGIGGFLMGIVKFLLKISGIAFLWGLLKKMKGFKTFSKLISKFGKQLGKLLKPLRFLLGGAMTALRVAIMGLVAVLGAISAPVWLIIAAITAIVVGLVLLAKKLGDGNILKGFGVMWNYIKEKFAQLWDGIKNLGGKFINMHVTLYSNIWKNITSVFTNMWNWLSNAVIEKTTAMKANFVAGFDSLKTNISNFITMIKELPEKMIDWVKSQFEKLPFIGKKKKGKKSDRELTVKDGKNFLSKTLSLGKNMFNSMAKKAKGFGKDIKGKTSSLLSGLTGTFDGAKALVGTKVKGFITNVMDLLLQPFKEASFIFKAFSTAFESIMKSSFVGSVGTSMFANGLPNTPAMALLLKERKIDVDNPRHQKRFDVFKRELLTERENAIKERLEKQVGNQTTNISNNSSQSTSSTKIIQPRINASVNKPILTGF